MYFYLNRFEYGLFLDSSLKIFTQLMNMMNIFLIQLIDVEL
jgi:hypothetical protein